MNEVYFPMNREDCDWLSVEAEAHQSWPRKKEIKSDKLTKLERQRKKERKNYSLSHFLLHVEFYLGVVVAFLRSWRRVHMSCLTYLLTPHRQQDTIVPQYVSHSSGWAIPFTH